MGADGGSNGLVNFRGRQADLNALDITNSVSCRNRADG